MSIIQIGDRQASHEPFGKHSPDVPGEPRGHTASVNNVLHEAPQQTGSILGMPRRFIQWYGSRPIWIVATSAIMAGNLLAAQGLDSRRSWAIDAGGIVMMAPIIAWMVCAWLISRDEG